MPEKLTIELASEVHAYYDNKKLLARSDIVFVCVPKHKLKNVFNDIRAEYRDQLKNKQVGQP